MSADLNCSNCGAPLDYTGSETTVHCPYCGSSVVVPEELRLVQAEVAAKQNLKDLSLWIKIFLILIILSMLIPACLGIIGTFTGIIAAIFGIVVAIISPLIGALLSILMKN